jgi:hypothetical protein
MHGGNRTATYLIVRVVMDCAFLPKLTELAKDFFRWKCVLGFVMGPESLT